MQHKDSRAKLITSILGNIKALKLHGWEERFTGQVLDIRMQELQALKTSQFLFSASLVSFHSSTFLVSPIWANAADVTPPLHPQPLTIVPLPALQIAFVVFAVYTLADEHNVLNAQKAFVSLVLVNILHTAHSFLPFSINAVMQVSPWLVSRLAASSCAGAGKAGSCLPKGLTWCHVDMTHLCIFFYLWTGVPVEFGMVVQGTGGGYTSPCAMLPIWAALCPTDADIPVTEPVMFSQVRKQ